MVCLVAWEGTAGQEDTTADLVVGGAGLLLAVLLALLPVPALLLAARIRVARERTVP